MEGGSVTLCSITYAHQIKNRRIYVRVIGKVFGSHPDIHLLQKLRITIFCYQGRHLVREGYIVHQYRITATYFHIGLCPINFGKLYYWRFNKLQCMEAPLLVHGAKSTFYI